jgi:antitoxin PrlF
VEDLGLAAVAGSLRRPYTRTDMTWEMSVAATVRKAKLGARARLVLPKEVRQALGLRPGDSFAFLIDGENVRVVRMPAEDDDRFVTFSEWASEADRKGYADL